MAEMSKRRAARMVDALAAIAVLWAMMAIAPVEAIWFRPGVPIVGDAQGATPPPLSFDREIMRETRMRYQVVIRNIDGTTICDATSAAFTYRPDAKLPDHPDLEWWTGGDRLCWPQGSGTYVMETCWTVTAPFWGLVPPKTVCRLSPPFRVTGGS